MKTTLLMTAFLTTVVGCAVRSPEMYRDDTAKVLQTKEADIRACYDDVLKTTPTAAGTVTVKFEVETDEGKIQNVAVDPAQTTAPEQLGDCVKKHVEGLVVAPPDKRTGQATYAYEFTLPSSAGAPATATVQPAQ